MTWPYHFLYAFSLLLTACGIANGQPVADRSYQLRQGSAVFHSQRFTTPQGVQEGPNMVWDYSQVGETGQSATVTQAVSPNSLGGMLNPANFFQSPRSEAYWGSYYKSDSTGIWMVGMSMLPDDLPYERPTLTLPYPCVFGQQWADSLEYYSLPGSVNTPQTYVVASKSRYSGFGTLQLPGQAYPAAILIRTDFTTYTKDGAGNLNRISTSATYKWYAPDGPLGGWVASLFNTEHTSNGAYGFYYLTGGTTSAGNRAGKASVSIFPNPAGSQLTIRSEGLSRLKECTVSDLSGRQVLILPLGENPTLDVSTLRPGLYLLTIDTPQAPVARWFVKE